MKDQNVRRTKIEDLPNDRNELIDLSDDKILTSRICGGAKAKEIVFGDDEGSTFYPCTCAGSGGTDTCSDTN
jgi:hypothetical protein